MILSIATDAANYLKTNEAVKSLASDLVRLGFKLYDALYHVRIISEKKLSPFPPLFSCFLLLPSSPPRSGLYHVRIISDEKIFCFLLSFIIPVACCLSELLPFGAVAFRSR